MLRFVASWTIVLLGSLGVGCEKDELPKVDDANSGVTGGDGSIPDAAPAFVCPPPETGALCERRAWWGRDLDTGSCCRYPNRCAVPPSMPAYETEAACRTDCRCATVDRVVEGGETYFVTERTTLECACESEDCPTDIQEETRRQCDAGNTYLTRSEGCGMIRLADDTGFTGRHLLFDAETGSLLGLSAYSDVPTMRCNTWEFIAGAAFECDDATVCHPCGVPMGSTIPACD
jgi:hypothetical protein